MPYLAWFDASKRPVAQKIAAAAERFAEKFGQPPTVCLVAPGVECEGAAVPLRPVRHVGANCYWIGIDDAEG